MIMKELQEFVRSFCNEYEMNTSAENRFIDLTSELGEVGKEILKKTNYGKNKFIKTEEFALEMGDLLFSFLALANTCDIDAGKALLEVLEKYRRRLKKGSAGSENE